MLWISAIIDSFSSYRSYQTSPAGIAIVDGGITGITSALDLVNRGISCKIHERGHIFSDLDAGVTFSPNCICAIAQELNFDFSGGYHGNGTELGEDMAANTEMHLRLDGHVINMPVERGGTKEGSADPHRSTRVVTEQDTPNELTDSNKNVTTILSLLNEYVDTWAIFDMLDHPEFTYANEKYIATVDAANSASPYDGSGAGFVIESFAVLVECL
ncbi:hypothetical protein BGAL_0504g00070 [Botrytis galanthina]|uniref:Uncharacterized protein n=1 Tax=Botrytis galanthina TaxID=278940 RepID=A0A4S8QNT8_9HELO|nr:hypothetical protein BGAL_0504g00070 [Botrytis galanthina]